MLPADINWITLRYFIYDGQEYMEKWECDKHEKCDCYELGL